MLAQWTTYCGIIQRFTAIVFLSWVHFLHCSCEYYTSLPLLLGICKTWRRLLWKAPVHRITSGGVEYTESEVPQKKWEMCCRFQDAEHIITSESKNISTLNKCPLNLSALFNARAICFDCIKRKLSSKPNKI